ncbi:protein of unknown function [Candidatus Filomicrobium marinum]|uniref:Uncharacterized protein n=1 Tax=Candidatus Filomicrobium marinum TaxID=1608628 RepID=A0A0D6JIN6_9HYPH|nr:hypothetical protein [Candidatus Filomicrobium marinum]CFX40377.1 protein of unknown function [Candidatus Filomicrobium marinum]CPR21304.1 protein of unknown function [Candidatus Filomicrobium marinum]
MQSRDPGQSAPDNSSGVGTWDRLTDNLGNDLIAYGMFALMFLIILAGTAADHYGVTSKAETVKSDLAALPDAVGQPSGTRAVLTGTIARDEEPIFQHFVAYVEESYHGGGRHQTRTWQEETSWKKTFRIDTSTGAMRLARPNYTFSPRVSWSNDPVISEWDHTQARTTEPPGTWTRARRFRGFVPGGPVIAVGTVTPDGTLDAEYLIGETLENVEERIVSAASGEATNTSYWLALISIIGLGLSVGLFLRDRVKKVLGPE